MVHGKSNRRNKKIRNWLISLILFTVAIMVGLLVVSLISALHTLKDFNEKYASPNPSEVTGTGNQKKLHIPSMELAYCRSQLILAEDDSIGLTIDLHDSIVSLVINGILLHSARIEKIRQSRLFSRLDTCSVINLFSEPFTIRESISSISHEPIIFMKAPKDTLEARQKLIIPDTSIREPVFFAWYLDQGIRIEVSQVVRLSGKEYRLAKKRINHKKIREFYRSLLHIKIPEYEPMIEISLPWRDARTIFRAMPLEGKIAIRLT